MGLKLFPREEKFFELFNMQSANVVEGAKLLRDLLENYVDVEQKRMIIEKTENNGDEITHKIIEKLNLSFITPMDREDIHALACALDDILDYINATAQRLSLYGVTQITEAAKKLGEIILRASEETHALTQSMSNLKDVKSLKQRWIEVNRLENEGDIISRNAIAELFKHETNPIEVIKWKELYEHLEVAIDKCEDAANIVETVALKNA
jgi:predicted phosphate transport protein (TIGR00153 family)